MMNLNTFSAQRNHLLNQQASIQNQLNQLNQMEQSYSQFSPHPNIPQSQFYIRQVGNIEEARSFPVEVGLTYIFPDTGTGKIYVKQLNMDNGKSEMTVYVPLEEGAVVSDKKEEPFNILNQRLDNIEKLMGVIYDKSISYDERNAKPDGGIAETISGKNEKPKSSNVRSDTAENKR